MAFKTKCSELFTTLVMPAYEILYIYVCVIIFFYAEENTQLCMHMYIFFYFLFIHSFNAKMHKDYIFIQKKLKSKIIYELI